ncbi:beta-glucosidase [Kwoniella heveanensis BCC8398]|uniref:beta-glucosidase n=1 Tax=Kwoniella heveanensis BCC8398 TaxID=1296120 RepID=A0A1B9GZ64_9TREE|nr:beta-glucosidase [Kwoniella heveanensis BCC8398]
MPAPNEANHKMDRSFLSAKIPDLLKSLTTDEKISLLAGQDFWNTVPVPRLNIPSIKVSDGPNGARGGSFYHMTPATALPAATALGATFSTPLIRSAGELLAAETKARNAVCLLAPTINIQRSPLGGRAFESFSEDPTLSGLIAAAYINGLQSEGVSAAIKHFVGNDQEHERNGEDSIIAPRPLREVYLRPFQLAQKHSGPQAYMTSYNKVNGTHSSENKWLIDDLLRNEWGFKGLVMSDWFGTYSVSESINAGLNLEMPGPTVWRTTQLVNHLLKAHKIDPRQLDKVVTGVLEWVQMLAKKNEDIVYAAPSPEKTRYDDKEADAKLLRRLGAEGIVLLKNEREILPLKGRKKVAVIGPNAKAKVITGGGSAALRAAWSSSPWTGLQENAPEGLELSYSTGCEGTKFLPLLNEDFTCEDGSKGFDLRHYPVEDSGEMAKEATVVEKWDTSDLFMADFTDPSLGKAFCTEVRATFTAPVDGEYEFGLVVTGKGWVWVDEELIIDNSKKQTRGDAFFGSGTIEKKGTIKVQKGKKYAIRMLHDNRQPEDSTGPAVFAGQGVRLGAFLKTDPDVAISDAASLAAQSDVAVIVVGLNADWESEGYDRPDLSLPLRSNELISAVAKANPNTVVVIQAGSAVSMPWIDEVKGVVYAWYLGNECGNAIADVVYGHRNPSGRLPITLPKRELDIAANLNYKSARTKIHYEEGIWVGYKHFNARGIEPLFPFGHGLSYTEFEYADLKIVEKPSEAKAEGGDSDSWKVGVSVQVKNVGKVAGDHSVHFYTCPPAETATGLKHPQWTLQAFEKVYDLQPGAAKTVTVTLDKYAVSHWDELWNTWRAEQGEWTVRVGKDAQTMVGEAKFVIDRELEWRSL